ncbi:MAG: hypothetical protein DF168_00847 [Candidatus Moanabacter tarae]|uniref:Uncharacterized protein n=1 Tax=Candidatus Moanibacter tarae TaxID=2200854 RepID=A0A2Z4AHE5_9BACT|nr:MAG: hypothetical protein DF168_00847 [Candidatus Moanabacter tarae]
MGNLHLWFLLKKRSRALARLLIPACAGETKLLYLPLLGKSGCLLKGICLPIYGMASTSQI